MCGKHWFAQEKFLVGSLLPLTGSVSYARSLLSSMKQAGARLRGLFFVVITDIGYALFDTRSLPLAKLPSM